MRGVLPHRPALGSGAPREHASGLHGYRSHILVPQSHLERLRKQNPTSMAFSLSPFTPVNLKGDPNSHISTSMQVMPKLFYWGNTA